MTKCWERQKYREGEFKEEVGLFQFCDLHSSLISREDLVGKQVDWWSVINSAPHIYIYIKASVDVAVCMAFYVS